MGKLSLILALCGFTAVQEGCRELALSRGSTREPLAIELGELEAGHVPENKHLRIGEHWKIFEGSVYTYKGERHDAAKLPADTEVVFLYYPIVSTASRELQSESVHGFSVLVRTQRYETVGALPPEEEKLGKSVRGLVISDVDRLDNEERRLLRESFSGINFESLLILQEGGKPSPPVQPSLVLAGGWIAIGIGIAGVYRHRDEEA